MNFEQLPLLARLSDAPQRPTSLLDRISSSPYVASAREEDESFTPHESLHPSPQFSLAIGRPYHEDFAADPPRGCWTMRTECIEAQPATFVRVFTIPYQESTVSTFLPFNTIGEVSAYIQYPFERDESFRGYRLPGETDEGPLPPPFHPKKSFVPPPMLIKPDSICHYQYCLQYINRRDHYRGILASRPPNSWDHLTKEGWESHLRPHNFIKQQVARTGETLTAEELATIGYKDIDDTELQHLMWEDMTFGFQRAFEHMTYTRHRDLQGLRGEERAAPWARIRDRIRRIWGAEANPLPVFTEK
ncbi:hypothetical protein K474DRAFT_1680667 [Panus rudis PR-1116 ss-1]|nr:hypothetical protein K474DRAFT_1680667 [Panus rudis PR-1116 ss-1]